MSEEATLIVIAEISIALAGFSGVAATFGRRQERPWSRSERTRLANLLNHSGIALFASLIPLIFAQMDGFTPDLWTISSLSWVFFGSFGIGFALHASRKEPATTRSRWSFIPLVAFAGLWVFQLCNALLWHLAWPYLLALAGNLGFAFIEFMGLVNPSLEDEATSP